ncbi:hypothetical protein [Pseudobacillus badius]|nr:hypothetical protein [Bacillus badius]TDW00825.1 hypothetical protein B0G66_11525 [Bacillus badius]
MRDHPVIEQMMLTGYPYHLHEEIHECEMCGRELLEEGDTCWNCEEE